MKKNLVLLLLTCLMLLSASAFSQIGKITLNAIPDGVCYGRSVTLIATPIILGGDPQRSYRWETDPVTPITLLTTTGSSVKATPQQNTKFKVILHDIDNNKYFSDSVTVYVTLVPEVFAGRDTTVCLNQVLQFNPKINDYDSLRWTTSGKGTIDKPNEPFSRYTPASGEKGKIDFTLTAFGYNYCDTIIDVMSVTYVDKPIVKVLPSKNKICSNEVLPITGTVTNYSTIMWKVENGKGTLLNNQTLTPVYKPDPSDSGTIRFKLIAGDGGCSDSAMASIEVVFTDIRIYPNPAEFCSGYPAYLNVVPAMSNYTYLWSTGATTPQIIITPVQNTSYSVKVTTIEGCVVKDTVPVTVLESPVISGIEDNSRDAVITVLPGGYASYSFTVNKVVEKEGTDNTFPYESFIGKADTIYIRVTSDNGCFKDSFYIIPFLKVVNAFSPNADGINDRLLPNRKTIVFDRTEKILYQGFDGWDGTYNGREMPIGTYFYVVFDREGKLFYKGPVTLLRSSLME